ncbi:hypothetical protein DN068_20200 [Taibaiella soli]|uniref:OmpA-like domain-containing protein n=2 Tax=Taibaiella soli TaxID=1649169 RepID=A0A2W2B4G0_9BACT|nr:hypothetical protein DN068_20200 [Taibaiella soli]
MLLLSCAGSRKAKVTKVVNATQRNVDKENRQLNDLDKKLQAQLKNGNVDSALLRALQPKLDKKRKENAQMEAIVADLETSMNHPSAFRKDYKKKMKSRVDLLQEHNKGSGHRSANYGMIEETLELAKPETYGLSVFFGSGQYKVPEQHKAETNKAFSPLLDGVVAACNKNPKEKKDVYIVVRGYADEQNIQEGTPLYTDLVAQFQLKSPDRQQLNLALSKLRADELSPVIQRLYREKARHSKNARNANASFYQEGYGEALPNSKIKDYKSVDERRRIVVVFWNVLPQI